MKYCPECKVSVNEHLNNCPLCGSWLEQKQQSTFAKYAAEEKYIEYPSVKLKGDAYKSFLRKKSLFLTLTVILVCVLINILITPEILWSAYVACGGVTVFLCVLTTIYKKRRLYSLLTVLAFTLPLAVTCIDIVQSLDRVGDLSKFCFSLPYAVPGILIASLIALDVMSAAERSKYKYYIAAMLSVSVYALIPQIIMWSAQLDLPDFLTFSCFVFAIANALVMAIIFWKPLKAELKRKMHL